MSNELKVIEQAQLARAEFFTSEQQDMIRNSFLNGASEAEARVLLELARVRKLNPITGQIHFVKRWNAARKMETWAAQVGIDGLRAIAARTGKYQGQDEPEFENDKAGRPVVCRVRVYHKDWERPAVGVAHMAEYVQTTKEGKPNHMWGSKPHTMLAKCAEALALRKAFPDDLGGLYTPDEQPDEIEVNQAPRAAPMASNSRISDAARRATRASPPATFEPPPPSPAKMEAIDVEPPSEPDGYAESLAQIEDNEPQNQPVFESALDAIEQNQQAEPDNSALVPFGKQKGTPISALDSRGLEFYAKLARETLENPKKKNFHGEQRIWLGKLTEEMLRRAQ